MRNIIAGRMSRISVYHFVMQVMFKNLDLAVMRFPVASCPSGEMCRVMLCSVKMSGAEIPPWRFDLVLR